LPRGRERGGGEGEEEVGHYYRARVRVRVSKETLSPEYLTIQGHGRGKEDN